MCLGGSRCVVRSVSPILARQTGTRRTGTNQHRLGKANAHVLVHPAFEYVDDKIAFHWVVSRVSLVDIRNDKNDIVFGITLHERMTAS